MAAALEVRDHPYTQQAFSLNKNHRQDNPPRRCRSHRCDRGQIRNRPRSEKTSTDFSWCVPRYLAHSPCTGLKHASRYVPRERLLSTDELAAIWRAADVMERYGRVGALSHCDWPAMQSDNLTASRMDRPQEKPTYQVPCIGHERQPEPHHPARRARSFLLGGDRPTTYQGKKKLELDRLSGVTGWTLHDIRRAFASGLASLGVALPVIERLLAHRSGSFAGIVGIYQRYDFLIALSGCYPHPQHVGCCQAPE